MLDAIAQSYAHSGGGLKRTIEGLTELGETATAQGGKAFAAKKIAQRVALAAGGMAALDTVLKEGGHALGLMDEGQTAGGRAFAATIGAFTSGHGINRAGYTNEQLQDIMRRGWAHDFRAEGKTAKAMGLPQRSGDKFCTQPKPRPLTPEENEVYSAINRRAIELVGEGRLGTDPATWRMQAEQILVSGRKSGVVNAEIEPGTESLKRAGGVTPPQTGPAAPAGETSPPVAPAHEATAPPSGEVSQGPHVPAPAGQSPRSPSAETSGPINQRTEQTDQTSPTPTESPAGGQPENEPQPKGPFAPATSIDEAEQRLVEADRRAKRRVCAGGHGTITILYATNSQSWLAKAVRAEMPALRMGLRFADADERAEIEWNNGDDVPWVAPAGSPEKIPFP